MPLRIPGLGPDSPAARLVSRTTGGRLSPRGLRVVTFSAALTMNGEPLTIQSAQAIVRGPDGQIDTVAMSNGTAAPRTCERSACPSPTSKAAPSKRCANYLKKLGITAVGAGVFNLIGHTEEPLSAEVRWLLVGSLAMALVCIAVLMRSMPVSVIT